MTCQFLDNFHNSLYSKNRWLVKTLPKMSVILWLKNACITNKNEKYTPKQKLAHPEVNNGNFARPSICPRSPKPLEFSIKNIKSEKWLIADILASKYYGIRQFLKKNHKIQWFSAGNWKKNPLFRTPKLNFWHEIWFFSNFFKNTR